MNSVAITGTSGYVGSKIGAYFLRRGWRVFGLSRRPPLVPRIEFIPFTLGQPFSGLGGRGIQVLIHGAYDFSLTAWKEIATINVDGTRQLVAAARAAGISRLILISSLSAFQGTRSLYGKAKLAMEELVLAEKGCVIRAGLVQGKPAGSMMKTLEESAARRWTPVLSHGASRLYTVQADDLSELALQIASAPGWPPAPAICIAANPAGWTLRSLIQELAARAGHSVFLVPIPWPVVWGILRLLEAAGLRMAWRSDSVLSLADPNPDIARPELYRPGISFRGFKDA